jgi:hypothetical protein
MFAMGEGEYTCRYPPLGRRPHPTPPPPSLAKTFGSFYALTRGTHHITARPKQKTRDGYAWRVLRLCCARASTCPDSLTTTSPRQGRHRRSCVDVWFVCWADMEPRKSFFLFPGFIVVCLHKPARLRNMAMPRRSPMAAPPAALPGRPLRQCELSTGPQTHARTQVPC